MVEFVRDVMIVVAVLATVVALAVRSSGEHDSGPRMSPNERPPAAAVGKLELALAAAAMK
jgi:hypothetical protein